MELAAAALEEFGIAYEADVVSAHRMPDEMIAYGQQAAGRGLRVVIAGAGGAAHLPGMLAAVTPLPVIGVPVPLKHLDGMDSLLSIVQMPAGVPVATVSIGGARNAGLLAARILAAGEGAEAARLREAMTGFQAGRGTRRTPRALPCGSAAPEGPARTGRGQRIIPSWRTLGCSTLGQVSATTSGRPRGPARRRPRRRRPPASRWRRSAAGSGAR